MKNLSLKAKKGFSLIELLVVIAIIGILSAVGITTYTGYTANAKKQSTTAQYSATVSLLNAEEAKCAGGTGTYVWGGNCGTDPTLATVVTYMNTTLGMKNPYKPSDNAVEALTNAADVAVTDGGTGIFRASGAWTVKSDVDGDGDIDTDDKSITTTAY